MLKLILVKNKYGVTVNGGGRKLKNFKRPTAFGLHISF